MVIKLSLVTVIAIYKFEKLKRRATSQGRGKSTPLSIWDDYGYIDDSKTLTGAICGQIMNCNNKHSDPSSMFNGMSVFGNPNNSKVTEYVHTDRN